MLRHIADLPREMEKSAPPEAVVWQLLAASAEVTRDDSLAAPNIEGAVASAGRLRHERLVPRPLRAEGGRLGASRHFRVAA
jgi:hypothetical protein